MRKFCDYTVFPIIGILLCFCKKSNDISDTSVIKDADGNIYTTIKINKQVWLKENLKTTRYNNGDLIDTTSLDYIFNLYEPAFQWPAGSSESYVGTFGRCYTWYVVSDQRGICPDGWHVPRYGDFEDLSYYLKYNGYNYDGSSGGYKYAKSLADSSDWVFSAIEGSPGSTDYPEFRNKSGFSAMPAGGQPGGAAEIGYNAGFWSETEDNLRADCAWNISLQYDRNEIQMTTGTKKLGLSVRCIKDTDLIYK